MLPGPDVPRDQPVVSHGRVSWLTHPPAGVARISVESRAFGSLPVGLADHERIPHEATPGELLAIAYGMFLAVALSEELQDTGTPADQIVVDAACTFDGAPGHQQLTTLELSAAGRVPGLDEAGFRKAVVVARARSLRAAGARGDLPGRLDAELESAS